MATYTTQKSQTYGLVVGQGGSRSLIFDGCSVAMTTAMLDNANDEVELLTLPKGAVVVDVRFHGTDMDTGGPTLLFDIGDSGDEDRLIAATTVGQTASQTTTLATTGFMYKYASATKILAYINTAATTPAAGTIHFGVTYFVDENWSATNAVVS